MTQGLAELDGKCEVLTKCLWSTSINLCSGYWQCHIPDKDFPKTAFLMRYGLYKWVIMPMVLANAPATFMQTINHLFFNILDSGVASILDNILVYLHMVQEHFMLHEKILACLHQYMFYCKLKKCRFLCNSTVFFGFNVMLESMCISYSKVQNLNERPIPTKVKQVQSFLGFLQYSHKLIPNFSTISEPLHKLTCKNKSFAWTVLYQSTFEENYASCGICAYA